MGSRTILPLAYTPDQAAAALGCSRAHIFRLLRAQEVPSFHIGRCRRILVSELEAWAQQLSDTGARVAGRAGSNS
jgi:excisionase family DNA binding protein